MSVSTSTAGCWRKGVLILLEAAAAGLNSVAPRKILPRVVPSFFFDRHVDYLLRSAQHPPSMLANVPHQSDVIDPRRLHDGRTLLLVPWASNKNSTSDATNALRNVKPELFNRTPKVLDNVLQQHHCFATENNQVLCTSHWKRTSSLCL